MVSTGNRIEGRRLELGLTRQDLASRLNTTRLRIYRLERGKTRIPLDELPKIARALRMKVAVLAGMAA